MPYLKRLSNFEADHQISLTVNPTAWLIANNTQVVSVFKDFHAVDPRPPKDSLPIFQESTIFPVRCKIFLVARLLGSNHVSQRFLAFTIMELSVRDERFV